jgi:hypothetical protein
MRSFCKVRYCSSIGYLRQVGGAVGEDTTNLGISRCVQKMVSSPTCRLAKTLRRRDSRRRRPGSPVARPGQRLSPSQKAWQDGLLLVIFELLTEVTHIRNAIRKSPSDGTFFPGDGWSACNWDFVRYAQEQNLNLDFTTPPQRPDPKLPLIFER